MAAMTATNLAVIVTGVLKSMKAKQTHRSNVILIAIAAGDDVGLTALVMGPL